MRGLTLVLCMIASYLLVEHVRQKPVTELSALQADIVWQDECPGYVEVRPAGGNQLVTCYLTNVITPTPTATPTATPIPTAAGFVETFDGTPAAPQPFQDADWEVAVHSRNRETWYLLESMAAAHDPTCLPPPGQHFINQYADAVFLCNNHIMTSLKASGYGVTYLTPNQMVDFTNGEAIIRLDVSTLRTSNRDWWDIWLTPYECNLVSPLEDWLPDLNGEPCEAIHIRMDFGTPGNLSGVFKGFVIHAFEDTPIPQNRTAGYEQYFPPSATLRQTFELRISRTHVRFGMPAFNLWWLDSDIAPLDWTEGVVQIGHHSYNPLKDCPATCTPNSWHWDNVTINPATSFTMIQADKRFADPNQPGPITFAQPAPANTYLRFAGIGGSLQYSLDCSTWQAAHIQVQESNAADHFRTYWTPIPQGTDRLCFKGTKWWGGNWMIKDISLWHTE